ncbi:MAG: T9SS type A sorting domain-containing protein [Saprospiraceae bacterium]|nr:T9SS type A sorting domain-containing protein [Saprospiraceae bacterium]
MKKLIILSALVLLGSTLLKAQFNGEIDSTFANNGILLYDYNSNSTDEYAEKAVFGPDGKLYIAGSIDGLNSDMFIARFNPDGTLDNSFGNSGKLIFDPSIGGDDFIRDMVVTSDNKVVIVGTMETTSQDQIIARFNENGGLDDTFNGVGFIATGGSGLDSWTSCLVDDEGRIVVAGNNSDGGGQNLTMFRFLENGAPDLDFGYNGLVIYDFADYERFTKVIQTAPNRYYLLANIAGQQRIFAVSGSGDPVNSFGSGGSQLLDIFQPNYEEFFDIVGTPGGDLLLSGYVADPNFEDLKILVTKLSSNGSLDPDFGIDGSYVASLNSGVDFYAQSMHLLADGSILVSGDVTENNDNRNLMTCMLTSDGFLISNYGINGLMTYDTPTEGDEFYGKMCLDTDGDVFLYGFSLQAQSSDLVVMKLKTTNANVAAKDILKTDIINLKTFPNPVADVLFASFTLPETTKVAVRIQSMNGKVLAYKDFGSLMEGPNNLDLSGLSGQLADGIYLLTLETQSAIYSSKLVKQ